VAGHDQQHSVTLFRRAAVLAALGLALVVAAAIALEEPLAVDTVYPVRVAVVGGAMLLAAVTGLAHSHPFMRLGPANAVTGARALAVALIAGIAFGPRVPPPSWALVLLASMTATADGFDGVLARRSGIASRFGARFDMEVDAGLVLVLSILVWRAAGVGPWIVAAGLMRYAFVAAAWPLPWMGADLPPSRRRQATCVAQIIALIVALAPGLGASARSLVSAVGLALLAWSFGIDTRWLFTHRNSALGVR
jgi:phosphatidylglycerophosphate synthase